MMTIKSSQIKISLGWRSATALFPKPGATLVALVMVLTVIKSENWR